MLWSPAHSLGATRKCAAPADAKADVDAEGKPTTADADAQGAPVPQPAADTVKVPDGEQPPEADAPVSTEIDSRHPVQSDEKICKTAEAVGVAPGEVWIMFEDAASVPKSKHIFRAENGALVDASKKQLAVNPISALITENLEDGTFTVKVFHEKDHVPFMILEKTTGQRAQGSMIEGVVRKQLYGFLRLLGPREPS